MTICIKGENELAAAYKTALEQAGSTAAKSCDSADTVAVCQPLPERDRAIRAAAQEGKNVLVPLPFAGTLREAEDLAAFCAQKNVLLIPAVYGRYRGAITDLKTHIQNRTIGDCGIVNWKHYSPFAPAGGKGSRQKTGGSALNLLLPELDTLRFIFGPLEKAFYAGRTAPNTDYSVITAKTAGGVLLQIEALYGAVSRPYTAYEASGTEGNICFDSGAAESVRFDCAANRGGDSCASDLPPQTAAVNPFRVLFEDIARKVADGTAAALLHEALESHRVLDAAIATSKNSGGSL